MACLPAPKLPGACKHGTQFENVETLKKVKRFDGAVK